MDELSRKDVPVNTPTKQLSPHMAYLIAPHEEQDAAKRISEAYQLHQMANERDLLAVNGWYFPVLLADGRQVTGTGIYPTKALAADAVGARAGDCAYVCLGAPAMPPHDALQFLRFFRKAKAENWPIADPDFVRMTQRKTK